MALTNEKINRRITVLDKDGAITEMLNYIKESLQDAQKVVVLDDSIVIRALIASAFNKYKREKPEKVGSLENLFQ